MCGFRREKNGGIYRFIHLHDMAIMPPGVEGDQREQVWGFLGHAVSQSRAGSGNCWLAEGTFTWSIVCRIRCRFVRKEKEKNLCDGVD